VQVNFNRTVISIIFSTCFIFLSISAILIYITHPNGYEISIYSAVPLIAWFFLLFSLFFGIIISLRKALTQNKYQDLIADYQFLLGLFLIIISGILISSIPVIRGYYQWGRGDVITHFQWLQEIVVTGHVRGDLIYPFSHIYLTVFKLVTNLDTNVIMGNFQFFLLIPALLFAFLFAKGFLGNKCAIIFLIFTASSFLGMSPGFYAGVIPGILFFLIMYLFIVITYKKNNHRNSFFILLTIIIFAIVPGHPNAVINTAIVMVIIFLFLKYEEYSKKIQNHPSLVPFSVLFIAFFMWISQFWILTGTIRKMRDVIFTQQDKSEIAILQQSMDYAASYGYSWVEMFCKVYGRTAIILFVSMFALYIYYKENQKRKNRIALIFIISFVFIFCTGVLYLTNVGFGPDRMFSAAILFSSLLMVLVLYYVRDWEYNFKNIHFPAQLFIIFLFIGLCLMNVTIMFPSPYILGTNSQYTLNEKTAIDWFKVNSEGKEVGIITLGEIVRRSGFEAKILPYHFGYDNYPYFGNAIDKSTLFIFNRMDHLLYIEVLPEIAHLRFQPDDFKKLETDSSVNKYYSNGETEIMYVIKL
jgi:hypothetical protein